MSNGLTIFHIVVSVGEESILCRGVGYRLLLRSSSGGAGFHALPGEKTPMKATKVTRMHSKTIKIAKNTL